MKQEGKVDIKPINEGKLINKEKERLKEHQERSTLWKKWGPYLSERQWGTVREDYSSQGDAWRHFPHDHARSRAYRWGEDGLAGFSDYKQRMCLSLALWNEQDPILKERLFGLANEEGNHGEDVKELYYYLDASPSHTYLKMLYKYPQAEYPYQKLRDKNQSRGREDNEFEIIDTGLFNDNKYFDVFIEYAQAEAGDILMKVTAFNRSDASAKLTIMPQMCFRNTWEWFEDSTKPTAHIKDSTVHLTHPNTEDYFFYSENNAQLIFTENQTNTQKLYDETSDVEFFKDAFHEYIVNGQTSAVNPEQTGTKIGALCKYDIPGNSHVISRIRLSPKKTSEPFSDFEQVFNMRLDEANAFYKEIQEGVIEEGLDIQRQAFAGLIWSKQFYYFDVKKWLEGDETKPDPSSARLHGRNWEWSHLNNDSIISMPDKWEYPWYAVWDVAFHCIPLAIIDPDFAKRQLVLFTREWYMHPNGQMPAYEWNFGDVNPPVHAWATWRVYQIDRKQSGKGDREFLEKVFHKLMLNFTWWVNRKDSEGLNIFQGGFLGLDNIGVFDRSKPLPTGGHINQADGTSWMAMYSLNLMRIALELAIENSVYEDIATKFFEHFMHIAEAMTNIGDVDVGLWDEEDQFFYDELRLPGGDLIPLKVRSMVGLIPLFAIEVFDEEVLKKFPAFNKRLEWYLNYRPELNKLVPRWTDPGEQGRIMFALITEQKLRCILKRVLDESEFLSNYGLRALSKAHEKDPYVFNYGDLKVTVGYEPAESMSGLFGGNSNWRGPIWFPLNFLLIESLQKFHHYFGDDFVIECPTGSGVFLTLDKVAEELGERLINIFKPNDEGVRPVCRDDGAFSKDPLFKDHILFYEYFHGDTGRGMGASHQTGWTGLVAKLLAPRNIT